MNDRRAVGDGADASAHAVLSEEIRRLVAALFDAPFYVEQSGLSGRSGLLLFAPPDEQGARGG
jgi:hypothetical protein